MKKLLKVALISGIIASGAFANENVGCGLGTTILGDKTNDSLATQVIAATLNNTSGNQTFGITSGTLGCKKPSKIVDNNIHKFVADNMDELAIDISKGNGERLDTLAQMLNIPDNKKSVFYKKLKSNFDKIYASNKTEAADVIDSIAKNI